MNDRIEISVREVEGIHFTHTIARELVPDLLRILPGSKREFCINGTEFLVYYEQHQALGDNGKPVKGDVTGHFSVATVSSDGGQRHLTSQHVGPHGTSGHGNPSARAYAAGEIATAMSERAVRQPREVYP